MKKIILSTLSVFALLGAVYASNAFAHCDTLDGPVVATARTALDKGDVTPLLKWVRPENEKKIQAAFRKTLAMRAKRSEAKKFGSTGSNVGGFLQQP